MAPGEGACDTPGTAVDNLTFPGHDAGYFCNSLAPPRYDLVPFRKQAPAGSATGAVTSWHAPGDVAYPLTFAKI